MEIRVLRYFLAVAREGSITQASRALHVTQPTLSRQLMELEAELGQTLFIRGSRSVTLTEEGLLLRQRAEEITSLIDKTKTEFSAMDDASVSGEVRIGCGESQVIRIVARTFKELSCTYPLIRSRIYSGNGPAVLDMLDKGLTDFAVVFAPFSFGQYQYLLLPGKNHWGLLMRRDDPLAEKEAIIPQDLADRPLICSAQALEQNELSGWLGFPADTLSIVSVYTLIYNAALFVEEGLGCALTFDNLVPTGPDSNLCFRPLTPPLEATPYLIWKESHRFSKAARLFLRHIRRLAAEITAEPAELVQAKNILP